MVASILDPARPCPDADRRVALRPTGVDVRRRQAHASQVVAPVQPTSADLRRLADEARHLHDRVHRVLLALALTEDVRADLLDHLAIAHGGAHATDRRLAAKRAHAAAEECRTFARHLADVMERCDEPEPDPLSRYS